jgi:hypothetical protein
MIPQSRPRVLRGGPAVFESLTSECFIGQLLFNLGCSFINGFSIIGQMSFINGFYILGQMGNRTKKRYGGGRMAEQTARFVLARMTSSS